MESPTPTDINESVDEIASLNHRGDQAVTSHQRGVEGLTRAIGRPSTLYAIVGLSAAWIAFNLWLPHLGMAAVDPWPFGFLQGLVSLAALLLTTMVLTTQNRQMRLAEHRAHLDLHVNLLTERKIAKVIALLEELRLDLPNVRNRPDPEAEAMSVRVDPQAVAAALDQSIGSGGAQAHDRRADPVPARASDEDPDDPGDE